MGAFIGRRLMIIWCRGCSMRQGLGRRIKSVRQANPITPLGNYMSLQHQVCHLTVWLTKFDGIAPNTAFLGLVRCWEHLNGFLFFIFTSSDVMKVKSHQFIVFQTPTGENSIESIKLSLFVWWKVILSVCKCSYLSDHEDQKWNVNKVKVKTIA